MTEAALIQARSGNGILDRFLRPLCFGQGAVKLKNPVTQSAVNQLMAQAGPGSSAGLDLEIRLQAMAAQLVPHPLDIRIGEEELKLVVAAYHVAWELHLSADDRNLWERRRKNLDEEVRTLISGIRPPDTEGVLLTRHLLLRHLPVAFRIDTRVEFWTFWGPLTFRGQSPSWVQYPLRKSHNEKRESVWLNDSVQGEDVRGIYSHLLRLTPLTKLVQAPWLGPLFDWHGCTRALVMPGTCRYVTNTILKEGIATFMPQLGHTFLAFCQKQGPVAEKRYLARFLLNLWLTLLTFDDDARHIPQRNAHAAPSAPEGRDGEIPVPRAGKETPSARRKRLREQMMACCAVFASLYDLRGPLGAAHLFSDDLHARARTFLGAAQIDAILKADTLRALREHLAYGTDQIGASR
jgi:hypothetical protein